jgi:hypothetical protein
MADEKGKVLDARTKLAASYNVCFRTAAAAGER